MSEAPWPSVGVVICTHNRPALMREALASVLGQDYPGPLHVAVVFDRSEPETDLERDAERSVRVYSNARTPGLAGARNTGIGRMNTDLVAFCDDDDVWLPGKLHAQVTRLRDEPRAVFSSTAMRVSFDGKESDRLADADSVTADDLSRSRMSMLHSSSFLFHREAMVGEGGFGLVNEGLPRSMAEDWDLLLRAAHVAPIAHVDQPLVLVRWGSTSYFSRAWEDQNLAHEWLIDHHPEMTRAAKGAGLLYGKLAFGNAAMGRRRAAVRYAAMAARRNPLEPRVPLAMAVAFGVPAERVQRALNRWGHGV